MFLLERWKLLTLIFLVFPALSTPTFTATVHSLLISLDDKQQLLQHYDDDDVVDDDDDYISETVSACKWLENCIFKLVLAPSPPIILESEEKSHSVCSSSTPQLIDLHTSVTQMSWTIGHEPEVATLACVRHFDGKNYHKQQLDLKKEKCKTNRPNNPKGTPNRNNAPHSGERKTQVRNFPPTPRHWTERLADSNQLANSCLIKLKTDT